ncbi:Autophagy-related protein 9 [Mycena venus]|uniref:Autophagy-related protein 9 n=1 Tax=Mycena venus TaxID=2733690 RepID=A0A8H6XCF4_9AGAR|nr:Autophagy-related protein 9 [Mycena venus]
MPSSSSHSPRPHSRSRSTQGSQSFYPPGGASMSSSRPFLNMLNPMARQHQGYQSLLKEEDESRSSADEEADAEAGRSRNTIFQSTTEDIPMSKSRTHAHHVSWDASPRILHPNIQQEDVLHERQSSDDEVPQSFMIEAASKKSSKKGKSKANPDSGRGRSQPLHSVAGRKLPPVLPTHATSPTSPRPGLSPTNNLNADRPSSRTSSNGHDRPAKQMRGLDAYERALWNWVNVYNLDAFLQEVYYYYEGKGIYSIALSRGLNLLTVGFVIGFSTFLLGCVDYSRIRHGENIKLADVVVSRCVSHFSGFTLLFWILFMAFYVWQIAAFVMSIFRLVDMYNFFTHLLKIPDADIQTISWPEIVRRIGAIREDNPLTALSSKVQKTNDTTTAKLDAHDIANRILRQENYLIALFNKDLLDLRVPLPNMLKRFVVEEEGKGKMLTRALEWNLRFCLMEYLFDRHGKVRKVFLKSKNRPVLIEGLQRRFIFMGMLNAVFAPFIVLYLLMYSFFRYFEEYHKDPSTIGGRRYTSYAQWKFREFNELPHLFARRLDESHPFANMYIGQFPNENLTLIMRFVAFVSGSFVAVLFLATVLDPDIFVHFEITPHRTVLFYLGVFGSVLAVARGMIPEENRVFDPELLMTEVITFTHYMPDEWKGQLHSKRIHTEFGQLFAMKVLIFAEELLSVVLTPFVLWFSLPNCAPAIIDFFREFTVHVDGRGYVCSFAEFNFERHGNVKFGAPAQIDDKRMISNEGKMEKSFLNFKAANPDWNPTDPSGSLYLSRMADLSASHYPNSILRRRQATGAADLAQSVRMPDGLGERAQEYDRALRQSQHAATRRRGPAGSVLGMSAIAGPSSSSIFGGLSTAQTAVLGDSQGSVQVGRTTATVTPQRHGDNIMEEDRSPDGGVDSNLGESYVDGKQPVARTDVEEKTMMAWRMAAFWVFWRKYMDAGKVPPG